MGYIGMGGVFTEASGVCKPSNASTLTQFKAMQAQLNRVARALSLSTIGVDGDIGPGTLRLLSNISSKLYNSPNAIEQALANAASNQCSDVAAAATNIMYWAQITADTRGISSSPSPAPPPISSPTGPTQTIPPNVSNTSGAQPNVGASIWDTFKRLSTIEKAAVGVGLFAAGVAAGFIPFGKKGRRKTASVRR